jgi:uncharacterized glyoxalase superfamily protein PhnB
MTITPYLLYEDVDAAMQFLTQAFGFEEALRFADPDGTVRHAEMRLGDDVIYLGDPGDEYRNPGKLGGPTVLVGVSDLDDIDTLCERARAAGAEITQEPADQAYGERRFGAADPAGHHWHFSQPIADVAPEDWGATTPA